ncbi:LRRC4B [Branchiostoma lanceolatum]|uniref:LRRC4B protein n=1 Tax=Branchiostoma lanceolatum TaxID=7740 RepID=A0A8J9Z5F2_BRALA|nr:LRRC4B [Branchiostoma lanceolatum]
MCNTTGQTDENQLGCLPPTLKKLRVAGHSDSSGKVKPLPGLNQLHTLLLGPGHILTAKRDTFSAVPNLLGLSMSNNDITAIGSWFGGIWKLTRLELSWNEIREIKKNALQPLVKLELLSLRYNWLRAVEEWYFVGLTNLKTLQLSYNNISHIAGKSFDQLPMLRTLSLDHNRLSTIPAESLTAMRRMEYVKVEKNPFRCTCALESLKSVGYRALSQSVYNRLRCSYPPGLSGRKVAGVKMNEMPCPSPEARVSRQDHGATLVCEVFWEKQPEIEWLDPRGRAVLETESLGPCGATVTTSLEHKIPTTQSPEGGTAHSPDDPGLPYIGKSTYTLRMSQQAYRCWTEGSFRCVVQSAAGNVFVDVPLTKSSETSEGGKRQEHIIMTTTATAVQQNAKVTERIIKPTNKNIRQDGTTPATDKGHWNTVMTPVYTTTPVQQNARITGRMSKPTDKNTRQDGTTPATDKGHWNTMRTPVYTTTPVQQDARITGRMSKPTDKNTQQDGTTPAAEQAQWQTVMLILVLICILSACLALFFLHKAIAACRKRYKRRQNQRQYLQGNAAGAIGGIPLQNLQPPTAAPTTGNPLSPQQAYDTIPDDTPIDPYAETSRLENPVYGADVTEPKGATAIPDPRPRPGRPINSASSRPRRPRIARAGKAPDPPPRSDGPADTSDSHYYPPATRTTKAGKVPALPPRTHHTYVNSNVSSQPPDTATTQTEKIPDPLPRTHTYINSNVSSQGLGQASTSQLGAAANPRGSGMDGEEEGEGPNIYLDLNDKSRLSGSEMPQTKKIPDPLPRTHTYVNSNVSSQPHRLGMASTSQHGAEANPRRAGMDGEKEAEGPNVYLDLNDKSRLSASKIPDPLPRTHTYVNSNISSRPKGTEMPRSGAPSDPQRQTSRMDEEEEVEGPNIYLNLNL